MGEAQGAACRSEIRARLEASGILGVGHRGRRSFSLRPLLVGPVLGDGMGREIVRHFLASMTYRLGIIWESLLARRRRRAS